jgi:hypothetical protein
VVHDENLCILCAHATANPRQASKAAAQKNKRQLQTLEEKPPTMNTSKISASSAHMPKRNLGKQAKQDQKKKCQVHPLARKCSHHEHDNRRKTKRIS